MGKTIGLNGKIVGEGNPCYIIAEIGSNHNREMETAIRQKGDKKGVLRREPLLLGRRYSQI